MVAEEGERGERETEKKVERGEGRNSAGEEKKATFLRSFVHSALTFCHGTILFWRKGGKTRQDFVSHINDSFNNTYIHVLSFVDSVSPQIP